MNGQQPNHDVTVITKRLPAVASGVSASFASADIGPVIQPLYPRLFDASNEAGVEIAGPRSRTTTTAPMAASVSTLAARSTNRSPRFPLSRSSTCRRSTCANTGRGAAGNRKRPLVGLGSQGDDGDEVVQA
jgi:hypothetical protein